MEKWKSNGKPQIREFGNIRHTARMGTPRLLIKDKREPLVDVFDFDNEVIVVIELPGVKKEDIKLKCTEDCLIISVNTQKRKYFKKLELHKRVDPKSAKSTFNNGVLEVTIQKQTDEDLDGETIEIH